MLNLTAPPQENLTAPEQMKLYRGFLDLTQAQLAAELGTTQTSVGRWEAGISPISLMTMGHVRSLITTRIMEWTKRLFAELVPKLTMSEFDGLFGNPDVALIRDCGGSLYLGTVFIEGYRRHTLHIRIEDRRWCALDQDGRPTQIDEAFLQSVISAGKSLRETQ